MEAWGINRQMVAIVIVGVSAVGAMTAGLFLRRRWLVLCGLTGGVVFLGTLLYKISRSLG